MAAAAAPATAPPGTVVDAVAAGFVLSVTDDEAATPDLAPLFSASSSASFFRLLALFRRSSTCLWWWPFGGRGENAGMVGSVAAGAAEEAVLFRSSMFCRLVYLDTNLLDECVSSCGLICVRWGRGRREGERRPSRV